MKDRAFPAFDLNSTIQCAVAFWHASVPFKRTLTIVKFCDRMKMNRRSEVCNQCFG